MTEVPLPQPAILSSILLLHSAIAETPDPQCLAQRVVQCLVGIPGVSGCDLCIEGDLNGSQHHGGLFHPPCPALAQRDAAIFGRCPGDCPLEAVAGRRRLPLQTPRGCYGALLVDVKDVEAFSPYAPFVANTANLVALQVENSRSATALEEANQTLEAQVRQRTIELQESENRWRSLFRAAPVGIGVVSHRVIEQVNDRLCAMTGYRREDLVGQNARMLYPDEQEFLSVGREKYHQIAEHGTGTVETRFRRRDGQIIHVLLTSAPMDPSRQNVNVTFTALDVTERARMMAERERLMAAIEHAGETVVITDRAGLIQYVNPAFERITGYSRAEAIGRNPRILKSGRQSETFYRDFWQTITGGGIWTGRLTNRRKDGSLYTEEANISPVRDEATGEISGFVAVKRDITKDIELEERVAQAQKMEAIGALAGGIAHDFNNILFPIMGLSEMLMEDLPEDRPERESVAQIYAAARRASDLVKQILAFSRQVAHQKIPVRIQQILKEVLKLTRSTIPSSIRISHDVQADCGMVLADPVQLHQIAMNLITNAFHACEDRPEAEIAIVLAAKTLSDAEAEAVGLEPGRYALLRVADNGCGIDSAVAGKIFEPYFTTKPQGKGTGLGLAVVYGIVQEYDGKIRVSSQPDRGTAFEVYLPLLAAAVEAGPPREASADPTGSERVLLVDDEAPIVRLESMILERLGYRVTGISESLAALETFRKNPEAFDLVVTDLTMPDMTGDRLAARLLEIRPDLPIILCTGFSEKIEAAQIQRIGIRGFLTKPVVKSDLARMVRAVLTPPHPAAPDPLPPGASE